MTDDQWKALRPQMVAYATAQIDKIITDQGQEAVEAELKRDPTHVSMNVWLGKKILDDAKKGHPEKQGDAIFHYARAAAYTGPGALPEKDRAGMKAFVDKAYKTFHGSMEGEDKLMATAANQALPDGFVIKSTVDVAKEGAAAEEAARGANPMLAQWTDLKTLLTAEGGQAKFDAEIKESALPKFKGKIISMTPALKPKTVVLAVEKDGVADCTLTFEAALPGKMEAGESLEFEKVSRNPSPRTPYMLDAFHRRKGQANVAGLAKERPRCSSRPPEVNGQKGPVANIKNCFTRAADLRVRRFFLPPGWVFSKRSIHVTFDTSEG